MNEKENTFNSIADRPLLVTSRWCEWGKHKWQKWSDVKLASDFLGRTNHFQFRYCDSCHVYDTRKVPDLVTKN